MDVEFDVDGTRYALAEHEAVHVAEELRRVARGEASVPLADRIERVVVTAEPGPIVIETDAENVELQSCLEISFLMPGSERPEHILALANALRRQRGDPEFHPSAP